MKNKLNLKCIKQVMTSKGMTENHLADLLYVSSDLMSRFLRGKAYPKPDELSSLSNILDLALPELIINQNPFEPRVSFRRSACCLKPTTHVETAQKIGAVLRHLVPFLPFDIVVSPPALIKPDLTYQYLVDATLNIRNKTKCINDRLEVNDLAKMFSHLQAVLVPVPLGEKTDHENAMHIFLPASHTNWVYINTDLGISQFKFWMAHELGHCLAPSLNGIEAEDFADAFAGHLLFPDSLTKITYKLITERYTPSAAGEYILHTANRLRIPATAIMKQLDSFSEETHQNKIKLTPDFEEICLRGLSLEAKLGVDVFGHGSLDPDEYVQTSELVFKTPFFNTLAKYMQTTKTPHKFISLVMPKIRMNIDDLGQTLSQ